MAITARGARSAGTVEARWRGDGVLVVALLGYQDGSTIRRLADLVRARLAERTARGVLFDATRIEGFATDVRDPGVDLLRAIRGSGVTRAVAAATSSPVRMVGTAIAFAAGLPLEFVESMEIAERRVLELSRAAS